MWHQILSFVGDQEKLHGVAFKLDFEGQTGLELSDLREGRPYRGGNKLSKGLEGMRGLYVLEHVCLCYLSEGGAGEIARGGNQAVDLSMMGWMGVCDVDITQIIKL